MTVNLSRVDKTLESHVIRKRSRVVWREAVGKVPIGQLAGGLPYGATSPECQG